ncbi:coiled-coil domain-containing protein 148 [Ictalurus punctatus]|uniref:Coiled-coil domain-containing protein 148 n=1 Tax=Ictalurus punctatus TaxID=7998 RepID=A0A2D0R202_ICTPU|nr:coiled-coil domain-containing protein 148 [Ictalurus punctatus]
MKWANQRRTAVSLVTSCTPTAFFADEVWKANLYKREMSGRDLRAFLSSHRAEDVEKLTQRVKDDLGITKYKPVQYDELQAMVEAKKLHSEKIEHKIQKSLRVVQERRESGLLRQHRHAWTAENHKLSRSRERVEADMRNFLTRSRLDEGEDGDLFTDLLHAELRLEHEREAFRLATVEPVCQLREDLLYRLISRPPAANQHEEWVQVLQQVISVKEQQQAVMDRLQDECVSLEQELSAAGLEERLDTAAVEEYVDVLEQIPEEILTAHCPYPEAKESIITAFINMSEKYSQRLKTARSRLLGLDRNCGWNEEDHLRFLHIVGQYSPELRNHRGLYMDMLQRILPHISRAELSAHERTWDWYRFGVEQERLLLESWHREQAFLRLRTLRLLEDARVIYDEEQSLQSDRLHQQHICVQLRQKLQQWHEQQEEVAQMEAAIASRWQEEEKERQKEEQEREHAKRTRQKQQVREFHEEQRRRRAEWRRREETRLALLRREMEEQARRDKERVQFREKLLQHRQQEQQAKERLRQREDEEREERLQTLRNQVAIVAGADPERMMGQTEAWRTRLQPDKEEFMLQKPLYHLHTYTDTQIVADPRVRIEQALRTAGLHHTHYARTLLSEIPPPKPPRRDTESTAFKS